MDAFERIRTALFGDQPTTISTAMSPMAAYLPPSDFINEIMERWEDEDPELGVSLVHEHTLDLEPTLDDGEDDDGGPIVLPDWSDDEFVLSRVPAEALFHVMGEVTGQGDWWANELEVLIEDLRDGGYTINPGGIARLQALKALCAAPEGGSLFHRDWRTFLFMASSLNGMAVRWDETQAPTPLECAVAIYISIEIRPEPFDPSVYRAIAATCMTHGVWCLPDVLSPAQPFVYDIARYEKVPISKTRVRSVQKKVASFFADDASMPDGITRANGTTELAQAFEVYSLIIAIRRAHMRGQQAKDLFLSEVD